MRYHAILIFTAAIACKAQHLQAPDGYELNDLGPKGGQVVVPKGWFYVVGQTPNGPFYTISKEDSSHGSYDTGMRIQLIGNVKATSGLSPKEAVLWNVRRKKGLERIIDECPESRLGLFWRVCLETEGFPNKAKPTTKYHLVYSFWWNDELDTMAGVTFGAPVDEWEQAKKIYEVIKDFKLIDLDRVEKQPNKSPEPTPTAVTPRAITGKTK